MNNFRKTKPFKIFGILSIILVPIIAYFSTQSLVSYANGTASMFTIMLQTAWIHALYPLLVNILFLSFIIVTVMAFNCVRKKEVQKNTLIIADIGYIISFFYLLYYMVFCLFILPTSMQHINNAIDYMNNQSKNFTRLTSEEINNLCVSSKENTLKCFSEKIPNGYIDRNNKTSAITTTNKIYYFSLHYQNDKISDKLFLINADIFVSDKLKIIAPKQITGIYNYYFYNNNENKQIELRRNY